MQLCSHPLAQRAQPQVLKDAEGRLPSPPPWEALLQQAEQVGGARGSQVCPGDPAGALRQQLRALQGEFEVLQLHFLWIENLGVSSGWFWLEFFLEVSVMSADEGLMRL